MRPLEIVVVLVLLLRVVATLAPGRRGSAWRLWLTLLLGAVMVTQLLLEGPRWQLLPLHALAAWFLLRALLFAHSARRGHGGRFALGLIAVLAVLAPLLLFPLPRLPAPSGPFAVGTFSFELRDVNRAEFHGERAGEPRRVVVRVWYPSDDAAVANPAPWSEDIEPLSLAMARYGGLPAWMFGHLPLVRAHASWDAPLAAERLRYPVVFFEHGRAGWRAQNSFLTEDLASHGYVVVAVEHPYSALLTVFADGGRADFLPATMPVGSSEADLAASRRTLQQWILDVRFVATALRIGVVPPLAGRLDLARVGVGGHSTGGASALELCSGWERCAAVVALDAWLLPLSDAALAAGWEVPVLLLQSDPAMAVFGPANAARLAAAVPGMRAGGAWLELVGSGHHDFDDTGAFSTVSRLLGYSKGPIRIGRAFTVVRGVTRGFLDEHLRGAAPVAPEQRYPEVRIARPLPDE